MKMKLARTALNAIILLSLLFLAGVAANAWQRSQDVAAYGELAEQRSDQLAEEPPELLKTLYTHKENKSRKWLEINEDFVGWLCIPGTRIDYPVVLGKDNSEYLAKDFKGKKSFAGSIFMDYRNLGDGSDPHIIIYGHSMKNGTMFGDLELFRDPAFFRENSLVQLSWIFGDKEYRIFSVYEVSADDYAFTLDFEGSNDFTAYLKQVEALSAHGQASPAAPITAEEPVRSLLTLVTCSYGVKNGRAVIHALEVPGKEVSQEMALKPADSP